MAFGFGTKRWRKRTAPSETETGHDDEKAVRDHGHKHGLFGYLWSSITHHGRMFLVYCFGIAIICMAIGSMVEGVDLKAVCKAVAVFLGIM